MSTILAPKLSLTLYRRFAAAPERVFEAWIGRHWGDWLPPRGATCSVVSIDPRPGGRFHLEMVMPDGRQIETLGTYREVDRPHRLVFAWGGGCAPFETVVSLTFRPDGAGTLMTLQQEGFEDAALQAGFEAGWTGAGGSFDKLDAVLRAEAPHA